MKIKRLICFLIVFSIATPGLTQDSISDENLIQDGMNTISPEYGPWFANLDKNISLFVDDFKNAFPPSEIDDERLSEKIEADLNALDGVDTQSIMEEIASSQDRHLPMNSDEAANEAIQKAPFEQKASQIVYSALKDNSAQKVDLLVTYLLIRFLKESEDRQAVWFILEQFRDEKLNDEQRLILERNKSYFYNFTVAAGATLITDLVILAFLPRLKGTSAYQRILTILKAKFPRIFGTSKDNIPKLLALPKPQDVKAPYTKTIESAKKSSLPSPFVIIKGQLVKTTAVGKDRTNIEVFRTPRGIPVKKINVALETKSKWADRFLKAKPGQRMRQLAWFVGTSVTGGVAGGYTRQQMHKKDFLWGNDFEVLPQEEFDNYLAQATVLKLQCAAADLKASVLGRDYSLEPKDTYFNDARELNSLFNSYALLAVLAPTLTQKKSIPLTKKFDTGTAQFAYDKSLGIWSFQRQFEDSLEVDSWSCNTWKNRDSNNPETSLVDALRDIEAAKDAILLGRLKQNWNIVLDKELTDSQALEAIAASQASKMMSLSPESFNAYVLSLVCDLKSGTTANEVLLKEISVEISKSEKIGILTEPEDIQKNGSTACN